jgi:hypothetical protein
MYFGMQEKMAKDFAIKNLAFSGNGFQAWLETAAVFHEANAPSTIVQSQLGL